MTDKVFSIKEDHIPKDYLTISTDSKINSVNNITFFSLGRGTDISAEMYPKHVLLIGNGGNGEITLNDNKINITFNESIIIPKNSLYGISTKEGFVYTEVILEQEEINMNDIIKAGEVFKLANLLPYEEDSVVNVDIVSNDSLKFVIMAFDKGTGLKEHAAPGEAIIFALEGNATIGYEGEDYPIKAGENFHFAKGGMHTVKATNDKFKMALLLTLK